MPNSPKAPHPSGPEPWRPGRLLRLLLVWTALTFLLSWLPFLRSVLDGPSYEWGVVRFGVFLSGRGMAGDFWYPAVTTALGLGLLWSGWRGGGRFFRWMLPLWLAALFFDALLAALTSPEPLLFRGDTLGIVWDVTWAAPLLHGAALGLFAFWLFRARPTEGGTAKPTPWTPRNTRRTLALAALLPLQLVLLRFGDPHGLTDQLGVLITIVQWFMVGWAVRPLGGREPRRPPRDPGPRQRGTPRLRKPAPGQA